MICSLIPVVETVAAVVAEVTVVATDVVLQVLSVCWAGYTMPKTEQGIEAGRTRWESWQENPSGLTPH